MNARLRLLLKKKKMMLFVAKLSKWFTKVLHPAKPFTASRGSHSEVPAAAKAHDAACSMPHNGHVRPALCTGCLIPRTRQLLHSKAGPTPLSLSGQLFLILCKRCFSREAGLFRLCFILLESLLFFLRPFITRTII